MGAPDYFAIRGGANPHTRTRLGLRKRVRRDLAIGQWHRLASRLTELGVAVYVIPADPRHPGLVYPANAGVLFPLEDSRPLAEKRFVLSNLIASRAGEHAIYREFLRNLGVATVEIASRFEGEADFFPVGDDLYVFTHGTLVRQRFAPRWGIPPWRRRYGFRSERAALDELRGFTSGREVLTLELRQEAFYHGDTCLAAFGSGRRGLLAYLDALSLDSGRRLRERLGARLLELSADDAAIYAANAFRLVTADGERLFVPAGVSDRLRDELRARGVMPEPVDVSEFWSKGGGSVKCMIGDLGPADEPPTAAIAAFRERLRYRPTAVDGARPS